MFRMQAK